MKDKAPVIVLEFNELSPPLMERFMRDGRLPNFKRLHAEAEVFVTDAGEEPPNLEPWIQWVTVHTGLPFSAHRVFNLGDGPKLEAKSVWDVLTAKGFSVGICGSMNPRCDLPVNGFFLPDPWSVGCPPYPDSLLPYYSFVRKQVLEYTNEKLPTSLRDYASFLAYMAGHGLSAATVTAVARQLLSERLGAGRWRRAVLLDRLQFDLFRWHYRRFQPDFSTFFLNSTAHFQHMYWRNLEPELYRLRPTAEEQAELQGAIEFGYRQMDRLVGQFVELAGANATIVFCTALSQQPCLKYEDQGGKSFYRPSDFETLLRFARIDSPHRVEPVMSEEFHVHFDHEADAVRAEATLRSLRVDGKEAMRVVRRGSSVFAGCGIFEPIERSARLTLREGRGEAPFFDIFYRAEGLKSGMHHPDGLLWIRRPGQAHRVHQEKLPLTEVAPMLLDLLSVAPPEAMRPTETRPAAVAAGA